MNDRLQAIRERVERATPFSDLTAVFTGNLPVKDAELFAHAKADLLFLLAKLDQAGKLAEATDDLIALACGATNDKSYLKLARAALAAFRAPTPPEAKP